MLEACCMLTSNSNNLIQVGGQAVIEGVMMRSASTIATAIRRADGSIELKKKIFIPLSERYSFLKLPILRGAVGIIEMLWIGIESLNWSAEKGIEDEEKKDGKISNIKEKSLSSISLFFTILIALALGISLFFLVPLLIASVAFNIEQTTFLFNLTAGFIRVLIFLGYLLLISRMNDVYRLFQYHGAEHQAVFTYENGKELTISNARLQSRFHPRCGTSFLLIVVLVSILFFAFLDTLLIMLFGSLSLPLRLATHLPVIPFVAGSAYEVIKLSAKNTSSWYTKVLVAPGLLLQKITTKEPDDQQLEVALEALRCAIEDCQNKIDSTGQ